MLYDALILTTAYHSCNLIQQRLHIFREGGFRKGHIYPQSCCNSNHDQRLSQEATHGEGHIDCVVQGVQAEHLDQESLGGGVGGESIIQNMYLFMSIYYTMFTTTEKQVFLIIEPKIWSCYMLTLLATKV
jgi:hypothetical protein